jgi:hypothetical protein
MGKSLATLDTELTEAKDAVRWLLDHANGLVNFHGLTYWAGRVESIREQIKSAL